MGDVRHVFCGILPPRSRRADALYLSLRGIDQNVTLDATSLAHIITAPVPDVLLDLLDLAAYVSAADQATTRGSETGANLGAQWYTRFHFTVAVRRPEVWTRPGVQRELRAALGFLTEQDHEFEFRRDAKPPPKDEFLDTGTSPAAAYDVGAVVAFSGGLDSYGGAIEQVIKGERSLALVTQAGATKLGPHLRRLVQSLTEAARLHRRKVFHFPLVLHKDNALDIERTQRSRSFVVAAIAATVARMLGQQRIVFYENGIVSLNLPISEQVLGARASRTTHPQSLGRLARFLSELLEMPFVVENPFFDDTKADVVRRIVERGFAHYIRDTVSCGHIAGVSTAHTHCGLCSQCIDRRFGTLAAGAAEHDPADIYKVDLLVGRREKHEDKTMLQSYYRRALEISNLPEERFLGRYSQITRALTWLDGNEEANETRLYNLYLRHSREVLNVVTNGVAQNAKDLLEKTLPPSCLLEIALERDGREAALASSSPPPSTPAVAAGADRSREGAPAPPSDPVVFLHVSDFHFSGDHSWDQLPVVEALAEEIQQMREERGRPFDRVLCTGDITQGGKPKEFDIAAGYFTKRLLPAAGVGVESFIVVSGNHDVDRLLVSTGAKALHEKILKDGSQETIANILKNRDDRKLIYGRHKAWLTFLRGCLREKFEDFTPAAAA